ncbi:2887_t:CDS:1, partial [Scutellospora calospora]
VFAASAPVNERRAVKAKNQKTTTTTTANPATATDASLNAQGVNGTGTPECGTNLQDDSVPTTSNGGQLCSYDSTPVDKLGSK